MVALWADLKAVQKDAPWAAASVAARAEKWVVVLAASTVCQLVELWAGQWVALWAALWADLTAALRAAP